MEDPSPNRDFYIQFTCLHWNKNHKEWNLKCLIEIPGSELIYDPNVEYAEEMDVKLTSWKNNWNEIHLNHVNEPDKHDIPLCSLYLNFKPKIYKGTCYMR